MPPRRVMLVEDDAAIRSWVAMALDDEGVDLQVCGDVDTALQALRLQPVQLLLTDLMLPGRNGYDLLEALLQVPALRAGACLVAFSAGLNAQAQARAQALGVWRCLSKPASLAQLLACVHEGLAQGGGGAQPEGAAGSGATGVDAAAAQAVVPTMGTPDTSAQPGSATARTAARRDAMASHFGGDALLFDAFEASCRLALRTDLRDVRAALPQRDLPAVRRVMHSLKSVLLMLGLPDLAGGARCLEQSALAGDLPACIAAWAELESGLQAWLAQGGQFPAL
jgi:DNA-binding response OmpR family regulator